MSLSLSLSFDYKACDSGETSYYVSGYYDIPLDDSKNTKYVPFDDDDIKLDTISAKNGRLAIPEKFLLLKKQEFHELFQNYDIANSVLHKSLPAYVIEAMERDEKVKPRAFESATLLYFNIDNFEEIVANTKPLLVIELLNQVSTLVDYCSSCFSSLKVKSVEDSYMIVSFYYITDSINT